MASKRIPGKAVKHVTGTEKTQGKPASGGHVGDVCGSKKINQDDYCKQPAGAGTDHPGWGRCKWHGGSTPTGKNAAAHLEVQTRLDRRYGDLMEIDPHAALLEEVQRTAGHVAWLGTKVADLPDDDSMIQFTKDGVKASVWLDLYQQERKMLVLVSKTAIDAGVMERAVTLAEDQGRLVAQAIERILADLQLSDEQLSRAPLVVYNRLLELESTEVIIDAVEAEIVD